MRLLKLFLLFAAIAALSSCNKNSKSNGPVSGSDLITATGILEKPFVTTYMYSTHKLTVSASSWMVLESTSINLDTYIGKRVIITAINTHYQAENAPEMYNVTSIALAP